MNWRRVWQHKTQSPIEAIFLEEIKALGIEPMVQYPLDVFYLDFAFPEIKLAIEIDGFKYHSPEKDAYKNKRINDLGWKLERFAGWFIYRYARAAVGKIALRYFPDKLNEGQKKYALGGLTNYFLVEDKNLAIKLLENDRNKN